MSARGGLIVGGGVYHVFNRGSRKGELFASCEDYDAFERLMEEARRKRPMRILAYHLMRTHFHFLLWPIEDDDLPRFMQWLTLTHAIRWHRKRDSSGSGAVYQSRYKAVWIKDERQFLTTWRYVERNALASGLVTHAEDWRWCSAFPQAKFTVDPCPFARPSNWVDLLNDL